MIFSGCSMVSAAKKWNRQYLFLFTLLAISFFPTIARSADGVAVGFAKKAVGTLVVVRADGIEERLSGKGRMPLFEGDVVRTDDNSVALLELNSDIQVGLNRSTSFKIVSRWEKANGITRILRLKEGMLWVKTSGGVKQLEVETPVAIAVVKGTEFIIEALKDGTSNLKVIEGLVEFGTAFGTCPIRTSTVSHAEQGKKCTKPVVADVTPAANWTAALLDTKASKNGGGTIAMAAPAPPAPALPIFWPPPDASTHQKIPRALLVPDNTHAQTWANVAARMEKALAKNGYSSPGYYSVPEGFALISQLERINPDATPTPPNERWKIKVDPASIVPFNLGAYLKALLGKDAGYFRVIAFVFTPVSIVTSGAEANIEEAKLWVGQGGTKLPRILSKQLYGEDMVATALIYEFEIPSHGEAARLNKPSEHNGQQHLKAAKILQALGG
ncbi:FecR family protein [Sulfurirhabdus autotrophica]|uniref:FecR family protein n=1 Tax=Sulfurirhabdus autotrophica TaxID=1706046 RepID=A0A4V2W353_9PROT|nr:FecR family protein [Sulfurirhabdus autotrophica]TCV90619.1 FecR family protein [Sulfurirhabdus autotrophica]